MFNNDGSVPVHGGTLFNNVASADGCVVYKRHGVVVYNNHGSVFFHSVTFHRNSAESKSVALCFGSDSLHFDGGSLLNNVASADGGVVCNNHGSAVGCSTTKLPKRRACRITTKARYA